VTAKGVKLARVGWVEAIAETHQIPNQALIVERPRQPSSKDKFLAAQNDGTRNTAKEVKLVLC
jgi:hypothetical protein